MLCTLLLLLIDSLPLLPRNIYISSAVDDSARAIDAVGVAHLHSLAVLAELRRLEQQVVLLLVISQPIDTLGGWGGGGVGYTRERVCDREQK